MFVRSLFVLAVFSSFVTASDLSRAEKLVGKWMAEGGERETSTWVFEQKADKLKVTHLRGTEKDDEVECNTIGQECKVKDGGEKQTTVSMYFLDDKLVQIVMKGSEVLKRRFTVNGTGDALQVELIPVVPQGRVESRKYKRAQ